MPSYAKLCQAIPSYSKLCQAMPSYAKLCQAMPSYAKLCQAMPSYAKLGQARPILSASEYFVLKSLHIKYHKLGYCCGHCGGVFKGLFSLFSSSDYSLIDLFQWFYVNFSL
jgi:hypothetical protein